MSMEWKLDGVYKMSPELFYIDVEYPCSFMLYPPEAAKDGGKDSLATAIIVCGGAVLSKPNEHCIHLIDENFFFNNDIEIPARDDLPPDLFAGRFIFDCIKENRILDIKKYRYTLSLSNYPRQDPGEILARRLKWNHLELEEQVDQPVITKKKEKQPKRMATSAKCGQTMDILEKHRDQPLAVPERQRDKIFKTPEKRRDQPEVVATLEKHREQPIATSEIRRDKPMPTVEKHREPPSKQPDQRPLTNFEECRQVELNYPGPSRRHHSNSNDCSRSYMSFCSSPEPETPSPPAAKKGHERLLRSSARAPSRTMPTSAPPAEPVLTSAVSPTPHRPTQASPPPQPGLPPGATSPSSALSLSPARSAARRSVSPIDDIHIDDFSDASTPSPTRSVAVVRGSRRDRNRNRSNNDTRNTGFCPKGSSYSRAEDHQILNTLIEYNWYRSYSSVSIWTWMETHVIFGDHRRSWQSLKNRFIHTILPRLESYNITASQVQTFRKAAIQIRRGNRPAAILPPSPRRHR